MTIASSGVQKASDMTELKKRFFDETQFAPLFNLESSDSSVLVDGVNLPDAENS
jgi:hypothetical protein